MPGHLAGEGRVKSGWPGEQKGSGGGILLRLRWGRLGGRQSLRSELGRFSGGFQRAQSRVRRYNALRIAS